MKSSVEIQAKLSRKLFESIKKYDKELGEIKVCEVLIHLCSGISFSTFGIDLGYEALELMLIDCKREWVKTRNE